MLAEPPLGCNHEAELYHLEQDPGETRNLAAARPDLVRRLSAVADAAKRSHDGN